MFKVGGVNKGQENLLILIGFKKIILFFEDKPFVINKNNI